MIGRLESDLESSARAAREAQAAADKAEEKSRRAAQDQVRQTRDKIAALALRR